MRKYEAVHRKGLKGGANRIIHRSGRAGSDNNINGGSRKNAERSRKPVILRTFSASAKSI